jgi:hypothetical protein
MTVTLPRLFKPNGQPHLTATDRAFLRAAERQTGPLDRAYAQLSEALDMQDVELLTVACRRFGAVGELLRLAAFEAERARA